MVVYSGGNFLIIREKCDLNGLSIFMDGEYNIIEIGRGTTVNATKNARTCFNACYGTEIQISDNCLFSNNIELHITDYHTIYNCNDVPSNVPADIKICNNNWIGFKSIILKGVHLADNTNCWCVCVRTLDLDEFG